MIIIDSHCHLSMKEFSKDLDQVILNARDNNIGGMLTICTKMDELKNIEMISSKYSLWYSGGVHPNNVSEFELENLDKIYEHASNSNFIGIGETGLDYYYNNDSRKLQIESFRRHIKLAKELHIPVIVHTREADFDTLDVLKEEYIKEKFKCLIHCFTASEKFAEEVLDMGFYISISGIITFKNADRLREVVNIVPLDRLLIETDAPYLAPVPNRGKRNEPAFVKDTAEYLAKLKNVSIEKLVSTTTNNFLSLFDKAKLNI